MADNKQNAQLPTSKPNGYTPLPESIDISSLQNNTTNTNPTEMQGLRINVIGGGGK